MAELRIWRQQLFDAMEDVQSNAFCRRRVIHQDLRAKRNKIVDGFERPCELHAALGVRRSLRVSHEATHSLMRSCGTPLPRSRDAMAPMMPATCHSLMSRYCSMASAARKARLRPVLLASFCNRAFVP